jgi:glutamine amidotransferase
MMNPNTTPSAPKVAIIDYQLGNVRSVANALESLGAKVNISNDPDVLKSSAALILPGVGAFEDGMNNLRALGLIDLLNELVLVQKKPILGICLGMQLMAKTGFENGVHTGLGWLDAEVVRFDFTGEISHLKVPHVGWNDVRLVKESPLSSVVTAPHSYYFVHSYYMRCADTTDVAGVCEYGHEFTAAIQRDNICGVQFHPEKSQKHGLALMKSFLTEAHQRVEAVC